MSLYANFRSRRVAEVCRQYGALLKLESTGLSGDRLLFALSGNESTWGINCKPRFEPAYFNGKYSKTKDMQNLIGLYGEDAAKSYGPWQLMLINAPGFTPDELGTDLEKSATATIGYINRYVLHAQQARTLEQIADTYNSGNWRDKNIPQKYINDLIDNYKRGFWVDEDAKQ